MRGHVDAEALAMCREGLLGRRRAARIRAHLTHCERCADADTALAGLPGLLAVAPVPPMPAHLAERMAATLAAEVSRAAAPPGTAAVPGAAVPDAAPSALDGVAAPGARPARPGTPGQARGAERPRRPRRHPGHRQRPLPRSPVTARVVVAAAAAVAVLGGGGYALTRIASSTGSSPSATSAGPEAAHGVGSAGSARQHAAASEPGPAVVRSGTNYLPGRLTSQITAVLAHYGSRFASGVAPAPSKLAQPLSTSPGALTACLAKVTGGRQARLIDEAQYRGRPATVIVVAAAPGRPAQAWVVGPGCSASASDILAHAPLSGAG